MPKSRFSDKVDWDKLKQGDFKLSDLLPSSASNEPKRHNVRSIKSSSGSFEEEQLVSKSSNTDSQHVPSPQGSTSYDKKDWPSLCVLFGLSVRATNVLLTKCSSLEEFSMLNEARLLKLKNCGRKTVREILACLEKLNTESVAELPTSVKEQLASPPDTSSLLLLPLFTSRGLADFSAEQLHPGFQGALKNKDLALSVRATNILDELQLETIGEVMLTPGADLLKQKNFGRKCLGEVQDVVRDLCFGRVQLEHLALPPTNHSVSILPLFSSQRFRGITVADLHQDFHASAKLSDLIISNRTSNVLGDLEMAIIGDVMLTPGSDLLRIKGFGRNSLKELREIVQLLCLPGSHADEQDTINYSSYDEMVASFIDQCIKNKRDQQLFMQRLCFTEGKVPTLEELGLQFDITRERARQILKMGFAKQRVKANLDRLSSFWRQLDGLVVQGGGLIKLGTLSTVLQTEFDWPMAPFPPALGQFLLLKESDAVFKEFDDLLEIPCDCLNCDLPGQQLQKFDFEVTESFHIQVVAARLSEQCQKECPWNKPVTKFYPAFIERLVEKSDGHFMLHGNVVLTHDRWREKYCNNLEDVVCQVLMSIGEPMHFRDIASGIRQINANFKDISDHNVHASIMRYESIEIINRGIYGLKKWQRGGYRSISNAIEELIDNHGFPIRAKDIVVGLDGEFPEQHVYTALSSWKTRFQNVGDGFYDRPQNWRQRSCQDFIKLLPESVAELVNYLVSRNNTSYKLVMAFIFIRSMDEDGAIYLYKLRDMFYNFYRSRHKKGLMIELDTAVMNRIAELSPADMKNKVCPKPLASFLGSGFFNAISRNGAKLRFAEPLVLALQHRATRDTLLITVLKAIDDYFLKISPVFVPPVVTAHQQVAEQRQELSRVELESEPEQQVPSITIKKKRRGKIKL